MTLTPSDRRPLPMAGLTHGNRSPVTCHLRCGDACASRPPNPSDNAYFRDVATAALSRRRVLGAAGLGVAATALAPTTAAARAGRPHGGPGGHGGGPRGPGGHGGRLPFTAITPVPDDVDDMTLASGYDWDVIIRWGDPILPGAPLFDARPPDAAGAGRPVRLQLRLPRHHRDQPAGHPRPPGGQPRVHQRRDHVPARHRPGDGGPDGVGGARHVRRRARARTVAARPGATAAAAARTAGSPSRRRSPSTARSAGPTSSRPPRTRAASRSGARSTTAPAARRRGAPCSRARRTSTSTSRRWAPTRASSATGSAPPATRAGGARSRTAGTPRPTTTATSPTASAGSSRSTPSGPARPRSSTPRWAASSTRAPT